MSLPTTVEPVEPDGRTVDRTTNKTARRTGKHAARSRHNFILPAVLSVAFVGGWTALFYYLSVRTFSPDSDSATVVLEGQWMAAGHLTLHGWKLSLDSFWSVDALINTPFVLLLGIRPVLLHLVPAFIAALVVLAGIWIARDGYRSAAGIASAVTAFALLGLPGNFLCYFLLRSVAHIGTALWCLIAFFALSRRPTGIGVWWFVAIAFLAAGLLGDFQTLALGVAPVFLAGVVSMLRTRSWRGGGQLVLASVATLLLVGAVRGIAELIGTFSIGHVQPSASGSQVLKNFEHLAGASTHLFGFRSGAPGLSAVEVARFVGFALVVIALLVALIRLIVGVVRGSPPGQDPRPGRSDTAVPSWRLDDLLLLGCLGSIAVFVKLASTDDFNYERYLTAAVIFSSILAGRLVGDLVSRGKATKLLWTGAAVGAAGIALFSYNDQSILGQPVLTPVAGQMAEFLEIHGLRQGIGDYWSAAITTVLTDGAVTVRPVISSPAGTLVQYGRQSSETWYQGRSFQFLVYSLATPFGVSLPSAIATYGQPAHTYAVGTYMILTWNHLVTMSPGSFDPA